MVDSNVDPKAGHLLVLLICDFWFVYNIHDFYNIHDYMCVFLVNFNSLSDGSIKTK